MNNEHAQDLTPYFVALATLTFALGAMARVRGFKLLDAPKAGEFDNLLFPDAYPPVPHYPALYTAIITLYTATFGALIAFGRAVSAAPLGDPNYRHYVNNGVMLGATAGVCFSLGAKTLEHNLFNKDKKRNSRRPLLV